MHSLKNNKILKSDFLKLEEESIMFITNPGRMGDEDGITFVVKNYNEYISFLNYVSENFVTEEINKIKSCIISNEELDTQFLLNTFKKVLYEEGDFSMYGIETDDCILNTRSLVFELVFEQKDFVSTNQVMPVNTLEKMLNRTLVDTVKKH